VPQDNLYIYDVKISGFTWSSIYNISRLRVKNLQAYNEMKLQWGADFNKG
jgi:hypothetical protein